LIDPRSNKVFYVGKGKGNRLYQHVIGTLSGKEKITKKVKLIQEIREKGLNVKHKVVRHGLTEKEAFEVESSLIDVIGIENLTNIVSGHHKNERGIMNIEDIKIQYEAEQAEINHKVMLININQFFKYDMSEEALYKATRGNWIVGERRNSINYALATYKGIIREVYKIDFWEKLEQSKRYRFTGDFASEEIRMHYLHKSITSYQKHGAQNPIKYLNI
jgi:hypothetical protein